MIPRLSVCPYARLHTDWHQMLCEDAMADIREYEGGEGHAEMGN